MKKNISFFLTLIIFISFYGQITRIVGNPQTDEINEKNNKIAQSMNDHTKSLAEKEKALLEVKSQSERLEYNFGTLQAGVQLMSIYSYQNRYKDVVSLGNQLKKITKNSKDEEGLISNMYRKMALALTFLGLDSEGLKDYKSAINSAQELKDVNTKYYTLSLLYENITGVYENHKRYESKIYDDSIAYYLNKSLNIGKKISDNSISVPKNLKYDQLAFTNMRLGIFYLEHSDAAKENLDKAQKYLFEGLKFYEDKKYNVSLSNKITMLNQISWLFLEKKEYQKSIDYANRALELEKTFNSPSDRVESFEFLMSSYMEMGEKERSKDYMHKYNSLKDSLTFVQKKEADAVTKNIIKNINNQHQESDEKEYTIISIIAIIVIAAIIIMIILSRRKNRLLRKDYEKVIEQLKNHAPVFPVEEIEDDESENDYTIASEPEPTVANSKTIISKSTENRLLKELAIFEKSKRYLKNDFSISILASRLDTNVKYASEIIKNNRSQTFNDYTNSLRIRYISQKLYDEPKYREYKISYLAEVCGYSSPQVFVTAFKKVNGVTPSYFIQNLNDEKFNVLI
ncbi:helix-turn-helix domain-containing protein [Chryseobacterium joostei]|uniref:Helix-turn-helix domain-containing protein n=1 Tax=Chryseobacterium joostei TaxID=112234 RepID=A0A1N7J2W5_9FLAO|nr:helix-turn-helix domain-containing protein [Chryseobacterium joostei]AZB01608.1 helix-turn-helix domain-containing protein [Chryseobacterium joostei]SIS43586.1 Helix-turn-helix domain-containing protein [Chryseobacterium joostei]